MSFQQLALLLTVLMLLVGCDSGSDRLQVSGTASYAGEPIGSGQLELFPTDGTSGSATGSLIRDGQWEIAADKGPLVDGTYLVRITGMKGTGRMLRERDHKELYEQMVNYIPSKHNNESTYKKTFTRESSKNEINFDLEK